MKIQLGTDLISALQERAKLKMSSLKEQISISVNGSNDISAYMLIDGDTSDNSTWIANSLPQMVEFKWARPIKFSSITIHPGCQKYRNFPSGDCSPKNFDIEIMEDGRWVLICNSKNSKLISNAANMEWQFQTGTRSTDHLKIKITESSDTGIRLSMNRPNAILPDQRTVIIREVTLK
jgi:hypothetical protein